MPKFQSVFSILILTSSLSAAANSRVEVAPCETLLETFPSVVPQAREYLNGTLMSLEQMRGEGGLLADTVEVRQRKVQPFRVHVLHAGTSPSNIAMDLLIQSEMNAEVKLSRILKILEGLPYHEPTGLFFSRYHVGREGAVLDESVSSIDNFHLALALWTLSETAVDAALSQRARRLFERMDFSIYLDPATGLIGGNLVFRDNRWIKEAYNFANFGSEARALYSAGWALGLFRQYDFELSYLEKAMQSVQLEVMSSASGPLMRLWDGAAFQLFFPKIFVGEQSFSENMQRMYVAAGDFMISEKVRRKLIAPAAHSAGRVRVTEQSSDQEGAYRDKSGHLALVSTDNSDTSSPTLRHFWEATFAPNAFFMAATAAPETLLPYLKELEGVESRSGRFFIREIGFMDGLHVENQLQDPVVSAQLSLNQGATALSLFAILSKDGLNVSARALNSNPVTKQRLKIFYELFDQKVERSLKGE
jgi:hypothetical protein